MTEQTEKFEVIDGNKWCDYVPTTAPQFRSKTTCRAIKIDHDVIVRYENPTTGKVENYPYKAGGYMVRECAIRKDTGKEEYWAVYLSAEEFERIYEPMTC